MRLLEIYFWNCIYWALYLPCSILLYLITGQGDVLGILLVGAILTAILTVYLSFSEGVLFDEDMEPAIVLSETPKVEIEEIKPVEVEEDEKEQAERIDLESEPKMRTDVDLGQLDADDDDVLG
jgi:hypothetical protein